jgi:hypothetical protein
VSKTVVSNCQIAEGSTGLRITTSISFSDQDRGYIADIPDLAHCSDFGKTPEGGAHRSSEGEDGLASGRKESGQTNPSRVLQAGNLPEFLNAGQWL